MIHDQIRSMLAAPPAGAKAPSLDEIEDALTAGYANALALEAERLRIERKIADRAGSGQPVMRTRRLMISLAAT